MEEKSENRFGNCFINIIITQTICVLVVLLSVIVVKYFFKAEYAELEKWYKDNIAVNTEISEVLE